jgi:hypothetical protein
MKNNKDLLIDELSNYIIFLGGEVSNLTSLASIHGYSPPKELIEEGLNYRKRIEELKKDILLGSSISLPTKKYNLFLDDERTPMDVYLFLKKENNPLSEFYDTSNKWVVVRTYREFIRYILNNGIPELISFDHDLADFSGTNRRERTGLDCAKWLGEFYMDTPGLPMFEYIVHSKNDIGKNNIYSYLENFRKFYNK